VSSAREYAFATIDHGYLYRTYRGRLLHPKVLRTDRIELRFLPSKDLDPEVRKDFRPLGVGSLDGYGDPNRSPLTSVVICSRSSMIATTRDPC
jgi:hypothetical protein